MNKPICNKMDIVAGALIRRYYENREFFVEASFIFYSGAKSLSGTLRPVEDRLELIFPGVKETQTPEDFQNWLKGQYPHYDRIELRYHERGETTIAEADSRGVRTRREKPEAGTIASGAVSAVQYNIDMVKASGLLKELGILTKEGKLKNDKINKFEQTDRFAGISGEMLKTYKKEHLLVIDCACGKSYLSFILNHYFCETLHRKCSVIGVDNSPGVIESSRASAQKLQWRNMEFVCTDIRSYTPPSVPDLMVSLHACDIATDYMLASAVKNNCKNIACVPCCHRELLDKYTLPGAEALISQGLFRARFNDVLTDALRVLRLEAAGYEVSVSEYVSPLHTPKNLMIQAVKKKNSDPGKEKTYKELISLIGVYPALHRELEYRDEADIHPG